MKKTIIAMMALAGVASAASVGYSSMDTTLQEGVVIGLDWDGSASKGSLSGGTVNNGVLDISGSNAPWTNTSTGTSWTLSFDIMNVKANAWQSIFCLASTVDKHNGSDERKLQVQSDGSGNLYLYNTNGDTGKYFDGTANDSQSKPSATSMSLGITKANTEQKAYTLTFVSDATAKTLTGYVDGEQVGQWENWNPDGGIGGLQLAQRFGGGRNDIEGFSIDNFTVWNRALDVNTVSSLIVSSPSENVPEPTTATLSLLALAGLAARRRRK